MTQQPLTAEQKRQLRKKISALKGGRCSSETRHELEGEVSDKSSALLDENEALEAEVRRLEGELAEAQARNEKLEAQDRESHDLCCRLAAKIGVERGYSEQMTRERDSAREQRDKLAEALRFILHSRTLCNSDKCADRDHGLPTCPYGNAKAALAALKEPCKL